MARLARDTVAIDVACGCSGKLNKEADPIFFRGF
jgi:hypothetical protein